MSVSDKRILIVDDEPCILLVLKYALEMAGVEVTTCDGMGKAREILKKTHFELVISDLYLSKKKTPEGLDLLTYIKERHCGTDVIIITGNSSDKIRKDAFARGASHYHEKQENIMELIIKIGALGIPTRFGNDCVRSQRPVAQQSRADHN